MNTVIKSPQALPEKTGPVVFLAGPMKGAPYGVAHIHNSLEACLKELKAVLAREMTFRRYL